MNKQFEKDLKDHSVSLEDFLNRYSIIRKVLDVDYLEPGQIAQYETEDIKDLENINVYIQRTKYENDKEDIVSEIINGIEMNDGYKSVQKSCGLPEKEENDCGFFAPTFYLDCDGEFKYPDGEDRYKNYDPPIPDSVFETIKLRFLNSEEKLFVSCFEEIAKKEKRYVKFNSFKDFSDDFDYEGAYCHETGDDFHQHIWYSKSNKYAKELSKINDAICFYSEWDKNIIFLSTKEKDNGMFVIRQPSTIIPTEEQRCAAYEDIALFSTNKDIVCVEIKD